MLDVLLTLIFIVLIIQAIPNWVSFVQLWKHKIKAEARFSMLPGGTPDSPAHFFMPGGREEVEKMMAKVAESAKHECDHTPEKPDVRCGTYI